MASSKKKSSGGAGSSSVNVYFCTNRNPNKATNPDDFTGEFSSVAVDNLRYGVARCSLKGKAPKVTKVEVGPDKPNKDPDKAVVASRDIYASLRADMQRGIDTLVFIHGYNVSFKEAIETGATILKTYQRKLNVLVFSWPSDGSMMPFLAYKSDRTDAAASAPAFARALIKLRDFLVAIRRDEECKAQLHLMAHSMGNYVLRNGIQKARQAGKLPRLFDQVFLMAADEDDDAFDHDHKLCPLPGLGNGVHVYFNKGDTALVISDWTKNNPDRLGSRGPGNPLNVPGGVTNIDCSEIVSGLKEHSYFHEDARVVADIEKVMSGVAPDRVTKRRYDPSQNRYVLKK